MPTASSYLSRPPNAAGVVPYSDDEHAIWSLLHARQTVAVRDTACAEFLQGLDLLKLPSDRIPQLGEVSARLRRETGWEVAAVPALIPFSQFFALLASKRFPAATFIRRREHLDYLQEPDLFHELYGHAPLLTDPDFAAFTEIYGRIGLAASKEDRAFLARLYWFTVEFGLIGSGNALNGRARPGDLKIYGGGILSSPGETAYALSAAPRITPFDLLDVLRTPYRIDILQPQYFVLESLRALQALTRIDLLAAVAEARRLGLHPPLFPPKPLAA